MPRLFALLLLVGLLGSVGCRMCASCYDHAGPVHEAPGYGNSGVSGRAGSVHGPVHEGPIHHGPVYHDETIIYEGPSVPREGRPTLAE